MQKLRFLLLSALALSLLFLGSCSEEASSGIVERNFEGLPSGGVFKINGQVVVLADDQVKVSLRVKIQNTENEDMLVIPKFFLVSKKIESDEMKVTIHGTENILENETVLKTGESLDLDLYRMVPYRLFETGTPVHLELADGQQWPVEGPVYWDLYPEGSFRSTKARLISHEWVSLSTGKDVTLAETGQKVQLAKDLFVLEATIELENVSPHKYDFWSFVYLMTSEFVMQSPDNIKEGLLAAWPLSVPKIDEMALFVEGAAPVDVEFKLEPGEKKEIVLQTSACYFPEFDEAGEMVIRFLNQGLEIEIPEIGSTYPE